MQVDIVVEVGAAGRRLIDPADLTALKVVVHGDPERLRDAAMGLGRLSDDGRHLFLDPQALVALAGPLADDPAWREGFDGMVAYAEGKGWTDDRGAVRAHVEHAG